MKSWEDVASRCSKPLHGPRQTAFVLFFLVFLAMLFASGCTRRDAEPRPEPRAEASATSTSTAGFAVLARGVRIVHADAGVDVARLAREERDRATSDARELVVDVGARWCEPCRRFHQAAERGELDAAFPNLTVLEFDLDDDRDRLAAAGYVSEFIPLFAIPNSEGRASERRFEGSIKGEGAVANIALRLRALLTP